MNHSYSGLEGCFWNPYNEKFTCAGKFEISECKQSCPKVCSKNYWKCNDSCFPISQKCNGKCMQVFTFECNGTCIPRNKPCNSSCNDGHNQINCNGQCLDTRYEKELIIKNGCTGQRYQYN